ncbi:hypothetical protein Tco_1308191 [Tanacetum coccineum]
MLLESSELTKDERESQLYDDFQFCQNKRETIHEYYGRFTKLIIDMRNIKMTMPKMQLNSKVVNNMLLEWGRFMTAVNLNRGLKTSNYDQLYAYLKQYEAHANENRMMLERYNQHAIDTLAFVSNVSAQQYPTQLSAIPQSTYVPLDRQNRGQGNNARGAVAAGNEGFQNRVGNANPEYFKDKMLLMQAQENGVVLDEEQLLFIAGGQTNTFNDDVDEAPVQDLAFNEDHTMFKASPSYDSDILSEVQDHDNYLDSVNEYQEVHKMHNDVQQNYVVDSDVEYTSDSNIILYDQYVKNNAEQVIQSNVSSVPNDALMMIINDMHDQTALRCSSNKIKGERGFEQTKECYLTEVIRFVKMLKEHFEGIQTALIKESKEMKEIFEQMEAEIKQMKEQISHMNERRSEADRTLDFKALDS